MMMVVSWTALVASAAVCGAGLSAVIDGFTAKDASTKQIRRSIAAATSALCAILGGLLLIVCRLETVNLLLAFTMPVLLPSMWGMYQLVCGGLDRLSELAASIGESYRNRNNSRNKK